MSFYKEGDFSFIIDDYYKKAFEHDYKIIIENKLQNYLINEIFNQNHDIYLFNIYKYNWYPFHNNMSLLISLETIRNILLIGWDRYVELRN
jgi:hypothetical protein